MLARYHIQRGRRLADLPERVRAGRRMDTRKHTRHCLRPTEELVTRALASGTASAWKAFARDYTALLRQRAEADARPFDELCELALAGDVFIGCSCPSAQNPDLQRCHTVLALMFMGQRYPDLAIELP